MLVVEVVEATLILVPYVFHHVSASNNSILLVEVVLVVEVEANKADQHKMSHR